MTSARPMLQETLTVQQLKPKSNVLLGTTKPVPLNSCAVFAKADGLIGTSSLTSDIRLLLNSTVSYLGSQNITNTNSAVFP